MHSSDDTQGGNIRNHRSVVDHGTVLVILYAVAFLAAFFGVTYYLLFVRLLTPRDYTWHPVAGVFLGLVTLGFAGSLTWLGLVFVFHRRLEWLPNRQRAWVLRFGGGLVMAAGGALFALLLALFF